MPEINRCAWVNPNNQLYVKYHDEEWGVPVHDDFKHFCMLTLEGAQAGLSWETILNKREHYIRCFSAFDPKKVAQFSDKKIEKLLTNSGIIRNRLKIESTVTNAKSFLSIQNEFGSFDDYIWSYVDYKPIVNQCKTIEDYQAKTELSDKISKDLKRRGFKFVGSTIIYAYMQAIGIVNDHTVDCFKKKQPGWSLYMIRANDNSLYTGIAKDVATRFRQHRKQGRGCAKYLRGKLPISLAYVEYIGNYSCALKREHQVKKMSKLAKEKMALIYSVKGLVHQ